MVNFLWCWANAKLAFGVLEIVDHDCSLVFILLNVENPMWLTKHSAFLFVLHTLRCELLLADKTW